MGPCGGRLSGALLRRGCRRRLIAPFRSPYKGTGMHGLTVKTCCSFFIFVTLSLYGGGVF